MIFKIIFALAIATAIVLFSESSLSASDNTICRPFTEKEINAIKASNNPNLIMGSGILDPLINPTSAVGKELLSLSSQIESPKGVATVTLIVNQLDNNLPLKPLRESIAHLLQDDKDNALSYYLNALLQEEDGKNQEALA